MSATGPENHGLSSCPRQEWWQGGRLGKKFLGALLPAGPGSPGRPPPSIPTLGPLIPGQLQLAPVSAGAGGGGRVQRPVAASGLNDFPLPNPSLPWLLSAPSSSSSLSSSSSSPVTSVHCGPTSPQNPRLVMRHRVGVGGSAGG